MTWVPSVTAEEMIEMCSEYWLINLTTLSMLLQL